MSVAGLDKIEIMRSPASALYGADAFAGVINLVSQPATSKSQLTIAGRIGTIADRQIWLNKTGNLGPLQSSFHLGAFSSDGSRAIIESDAQSLLDQADQTNASLALGSLNNQTDNLELRSQLQWQNWQWFINWQHRQTGTGTGVAQALDPIGQQSSSRVLTQLSQHSKLNSQATIGTEISYFQTLQQMDELLRLYPKGSTGGLGQAFPEGVIGAPEVYERKYKWHSHLNWRAIPLHQLRLGIGYNQDDLYKVKELKNFRFTQQGQLLKSPNGKLFDVTNTPEAFIPEVSRHSYFVYLQDIYQLHQQWQLTSGLRYDHYSDFGATTNPRLALVWSASDTLNAKLLYGQAFRAPAFVEQYGQNNPVALGNPNINPEQIETSELAFDYLPTANLKLKLSLFYYHWTDKISFVPDNNTINSATAQNTGQQTAKGLELELDSARPIAN